MYAHSGGENSTFALSYEERIYLLKKEKCGLSEDKYRNVDVVAREKVQERQVRRQSGIKRLNIFFGISGLQCKEQERGNLGGDLSPQLLAQ